MSDVLGKTIGQYQLIEFIERGGITVVYKGFQPSMNRYVTVKILSPSLTRDRAFVQRFQQEVQLIAQLEYLPILPIYDYGEQEGLVYVVTRYADEDTLRDHLPHFYLPQKALELIRPIAEALDYVHRQGVVHGNLSPSNILIDPRGQPLLTDFGFAQKMVEVAPNNIYMSPEQAQGLPIDGRTDVYALGVILYEMLVGGLPSAAPLPSPRLRRPDLPVEVEKVILKAMAQYPEHRFQTTGELSNALQFAVTQPIPPAPAPVVVAQPVPPPPTAAPRRDTSWLIFLLGGLAVLALIGAVIFFLFFFRPSDGDTPLSPTATFAPEAVPPTAAPTEAPPTATEAPDVELPTQAPGGPPDELPAEPPPETPGG